MRRKMLYLVGTLFAFLAISAFADDPPTASNLSTPESYTEDISKNLTDIVVSDVDSPNITATLTLSIPGAGSLTTGTSGAVTSTYSAGIWTASGAIADVNTLLAGVSYVPTPNFNGSFSIATSVSDGVSPAVTGNKAMTGTPFNDPPTSIAPASASGTEDSDINFTGGNSLSVADVDSSALTVTLSVTHGTLTLGTLTGLSFLTGTGTADASMSFSGSQVNLNAALATLSFAPTADYNSLALLTFTVTDNITSAVTKNVLLTISPVADVVNDSVATVKNVPLVFNPLTGDGGGSADNFEGSAFISGLSSATNGTVSVDEGNYVTYTPDTNYVGSDSFTYTVNAAGSSEIGIISVTVGIPPGVNVPGSPTNPVVGNSHTPSFVFTTSGDFTPLTTYARVDADAFTNATSPFTAPSLPDGSHTLEVYTVDTLGNISATNSLAFEIDTIAPVVNIPGSPSNPSIATVPQPSFVFSVSAGGTSNTTVFRFDGDPFVSGNSPVTAPGQLTNGFHILEVQATDAAGNIGLDTRAFSVDVPPPTATPLANQTVCPGADVTFSTTASGTDPLTYVWTKDSLVIAGAVTNTLTLTNVSSTNAGLYCVEVSDNYGAVTKCATLAFEIPPAVTGPSNLWVQCFGDIPTPDTNTIIFTGGTIAATAEFFGDAFATNGCEIDVTRTYKITDACGVISYYTQIITNLDTTPPVIVCETNRTYECGDAWDFDVPAVNDGCSGTNVTLQVQATVTNSITGGSFWAERTWVAFDVCGNSNTCSQIITNLDLTSPVLVSTNRNVECGTAWDFDLPVVSDSCSPSNITLNALTTVTNPLCGETFFATRTWSATDECGNSNSTSQTITIVDTTPPTILCNTNRAYECGDAWTFDVPGVSDCSGTNITLAVQGTVTNTICGGSYWAERTWVAFDLCGNSNTCSQIVTNIDTTPPTIVCETNRTYECGTAWTFDVPGFSDDCSGTNVTLSVQGTVTNSICGGSYWALRTWVAVDACGNSNTCSQIVTNRDTTPPTMLITNRFVECSSAWTFDVPTVIDGCSLGNVNPFVLTTVTNPLCGKTFSATRTWGAIDECGNSNSCLQTITVIDTTPPVINCVADRVVECGDAWTFDAPTAYDTCASTNVTVNVLTTVTNPLCGITFSATRTWVATDECGKTNICSQTITIHDTIAPTITCPTNIITAEVPHDSGGAIVTFSTPVSTDVCDSIPGIVSVPASGSTFLVGTNTVLSTVVDDCGNSNTCSFTIRVHAYRLKVINTNNAGFGSLRQAMLDANDAPGENVIEFNIPGSGPRRIILSNSLPAITSPVIIDGWTQPGFSNAPLIEVSGNTNLTNGLVLYAGSNTVRGLVLNGFTTAIRIETNGANIIRGNYIGTGPNGTNGPGNRGDGIFLSTGNNLIGGTAASSANIIAGNTNHGVLFVGASATNNLVQGNFVGVGVGQVACPNGVDGVHFGTGAARNTIGASSGPGANVIARNGRNGITLETGSGSGNVIYANILSNNVALGIDLGDNGVTANDSVDSDTGPNGLQNYPVITDARSSAADGATIIEGTLTSIPNQTYRLDFYLNNTADPTTFGEGQIYLGSGSVSLGASGTLGFAVAFPVVAVYTQFVTVTATGPGGDTSEFSQAKQVRTPPVIEAAPLNTTVAPGGSVTLCTTVSGTPPIYYQWRLNGEIIPGATNACLTITGVQAANGGTYSVGILNDLGSAATASAKLFVTISNAIAAGDNFVNRVRLFGTNSTTAGSNINATREVGEPVHADKPGGKSVWYTWRAPLSGSGIMTIGTTGSDFDTLLGVYSGTNVTNLVKVASDEDGGGYFTSGIRFNAIAGQFYHFAIDGYGGDEGNFVFGWQFTRTDYLLPIITLQPKSITVLSNAPATLTVAATLLCPSGQTNCYDLSDYPQGYAPYHSIRWLYQGVPIPFAYSNSYTIPHVRATNVGEYVAEITAHYWIPGQFSYFSGYDLKQVIESAAADVQINGTTAETVQAKDKLLDSLLSDPLLIGEPTTTTQSLAPPAGRFSIAAFSSVPASASVAANSVVRSFTGTQVFNTAGSTTSTADDPFCGVLGGASEWITFIAQASGNLHLNTDGSSYDTVMAVFRRNGNQLQQLTCDNNGGLDGRDSSLAVPVVVGETNVILVDGVNGVSGILQLNYNLISTDPGSIVITPLGFNQGAFQLQVVGPLNMHFSIFATTNLAAWPLTPVLTTTSAGGEYIFNDAVTGPARFYRAVLLP